MPKNRNTGLQRLLPFGVMLCGATVGGIGAPDWDLGGASPSAALASASAQPSPHKSDHATESAPAGMVIQPSPYSVAETGDRLTALLAERGVTVFARIDHAAGAQSVDLDLRPTEVIIFGNPNVGTPLMQCGQSTAIDLPQKALIWEDASGQVYLGYNDPAYLAERHGLEGCEEAIAQVSTILMNLTNSVLVSE